MLINKYKQRQLCVCACVLSNHNVYNNDNKNYLIVKKGYILLDS